jgi:hypothetical protein
LKACEVEAKKGVFELIVVNLLVLKERSRLRKKFKMVSSQNRNENVSVSTKYFRTEALNEWIKNVRSKKIHKRRQSKGQDLRTLAILTHTLVENQKVLRKKQKERSERWMELKKTLENGSFKSEKSDNSDIYDLEKLKTEEEKKNEIKALWKEELNEIDNFITSLNSIKTTLVR